jgi:hypothetical protein
LSVCLSVCLSVSPSVHPLIHPSVLPSVHPSVHPSIRPSIRPSIQEQLKKRGVRSGTDFIVKSRAKPHINAEIFAKHICIVFLPNINELRTLGEFADEQAILLMDNCPSHVTEAIFALLRDALVRVIISAPHTRQISQHLDVSLFGVLKRRGQYKLRFNDDQSTADFSFKVYWTFKQTMIDADISGTFQGIGLGFDTRAEPNRVLFMKKIEGKSRISGNLAARLPNGETMGPTSEGGVWGD